MLCYRLSIVTLHTRFPGQMESLDGYREQCRIWGWGVEGGGGGGGGV